MDESQSINATQLPLSGQLKVTSVFAMPGLLRKQIYITAEVEAGEISIGDFLTPFPAGTGKKYRVKSITRSNDDFINNMGSRLGNLTEDQLDDPKYVATLFKDPEHEMTQDIERATSGEIIGAELKGLKLKDLEEGAVLVKA